MMWLLMVGGLVLLVAGAELLVRGASRLAAAFAIPPLVIGMTIVAYGTSTPEMAVSLRAVAAGQPDIVMGNAVGSNTFNVLFILGLWLDANELETIVESATGAPMPPPVAAAP